MFNKVEIQQGRRLVTAYEYTLFAFRTEKGTFTLSGTSSDGTDEWRQIGTSNFHTWERRQVYDWFVNGKISAVSESNTLDWNTNPTKNRKK